MYNITLVCTIHNELGKCNSNELFNIIEFVGPDIIFEELSSEHFDNFYKESHIANEPLEIKAIKKYLQNHSIEHIPVDIDLNHNLSTNDIEYMFGTFKKYDVYKKLDEAQSEMTARDGFSFLNSKKCIKLFEKKKVAEENIIAFSMNKIRLLHIRKMFYEEHEKRENKMLQNIYEYSMANKYDKGIYMVGAGHRKSVMRQISDFKKKEKIKLNWTFYDEISHR